MNGEEAVAVFAEVGLEACEEHHFQGLQLRHLVKSSTDVKAALPPTVHGDAPTWRTRS